MAKSWSLTYHSFDTSLQSILVQLPLVRSAPVFCRYALDDCQYRNETEVLMGQKIKVACHIHSEWSYDAFWTLPDLANFFSKRGFKALLMTEHDRGFNEAKLNDYKKACSAVSNENIMLIPGIEYSDPTNTIHILTWGEAPFFGENQETYSMLKHVDEHKGLAVFAHPSRKSAWKRFDSKWTPLLQGIEVWNRKSDGISPSPHARRIASDTRLPGFYGLDFHRINQNFPLYLEANLPQNKNDPATLVESIRSGKFTSRAFYLDSSVVESKPIRAFTIYAEALRRVVARSLRRKSSRK